MSPNLLLILRGKEECNIADEILTAYKMRFKSIDVLESEIGPFLYQDMQIDRVPALITPTETYIGVENIVSYVRNNSH